MNIKLFYFTAVILLISSCTKESKQEADFRENNPSYAKLTVEGGLIDVVSTEWKNQSLILNNAFYYEKAKNQYLHFSSFKTGGVLCGNYGSDTKFTLDGVSYTIKVSEQLKLKLGSDNKYKVDTLLKCDK
ncbi:hypothetical protein ACR79R_20285 [Sphingobacterium spiritivorum]|uniref:hypothetical protein n=1 Tax=Sphingobacterium spiritivorum TaxID=258 RepID=UPI003DA47D5F